MQVFDLTFDVSVQSYLVALTRGACVYTVPYGQVKYLYAASLIQEQGIPFAVKLKKIPTDDEAIAAMRKLSEISQANGNSKMSLDEVNAEIAAARAGR